MIAYLRDTSQSLTFRIAVLLALALLPIGIISISTTFALLKNVDSRAEATLLALTSEAVGNEESLMRAGVGAATIFAAIVPELQKNGVDCGAPLGRFLKDFPGFSFAGYVDASGEIVCAAGAHSGKYAHKAAFEQMMDEPKPRVTLSNGAERGGPSSIVASVPVFRDTRYEGFVSISFPVGSLIEPMDDLSPERPIDLITYNSDAEILTASSGLETVEDRLPANIELARLSRGGDFAFIDWTRDGNLRVFAVVPVVPDQVFALGSWSHKRDDVIAGISVTTSVLFPVAMWIVCLGVGFFAVQRMVIRPTRNLRARMLTFMRSRRVAPTSHDFATPRELREMEDTWARLAESVQNDEARLRDTIKQRTVLLKEVHHRVKNNLQLIVSILNMKVRKAKAVEEKAALSEIRQRVMGIARVHQNLYETSTTEEVNAGELLSAIVGETVRSTVANPGDIDFRESYDDITIYPDQAVPLSLAITELLTNALKNMGTPDAADDKPMLSVRLDRTGGGEAVVRLCNSVAEARDIDEDLTGSGLGVALIKAFTQQMGGTYDACCTKELYSAALRFPIAEFDDTGVPDKIPPLQCQPAE